MKIENEAHVAAPGHSSCNRSAPAVRCPSGNIVAQQAPISTPVRTVLALASLPSVVEAPIFFKLSKIELEAGNTTNYAGPIGFVYVVSGSLTVESDAGKRTLEAGDALLATADTVPFIHCGGRQSRHSSCIGCLDEPMNWMRPRSGNLRSCGALPHPLADSRA